jgi:hypothetical protein
LGLFPFFNEDDFDDLALPTGEGDLFRAFLWMSDCISSTIYLHCFALPGAVLGLIMIVGWIALPWAFVFKVVENHTMLLKELY